MALWTPADITTALWLDANDSSTLFSDAGVTQAVNSDPIYQWNDKSGNGVNAVQATSGNRPILNGNEVTFDGVDDRLVFSTPVIQTTHSLFIVFKPTIESVIGSLIGQWASGQTGRYVWNVNQDDAGAVAAGQLNTFNSTTTAGGGTAGFLSSVSISNANTLVASVSQTGTEQWKVYKDGTEWDSGTITSVYQGVNTALGESSAVLATTNPYDGAIQEIVYLNSYVDTANRQRIEGYLAHKWGLEANLPAAHPYKAYAPGDPQSAAPRSTLWTPAEITTALWLDADDSSTLFSDAGVTQAVNSDPIYQWNDKSGNGYHVTQATLASRPVYDINGFTSQPSVTFASGDLLSIASTNIPEDGDLTFVAVFEMTGTGDWQTVVGHNADVAVNASGQIFIQRSSNRNAFSYHNSGLADNYPNAAVDVANYTDPAIVAITRSGGFTSGNGSTGIITATGATSNYRTEYVQNWDTQALAGSEIMVGGRQQNAVGYFEGNISEVICLNYGASEIERQRIEGYLAHKWGLEANLPADHPYKAYAPGSKVTELTTAYNTFITGCKAAAWTPADITTALWLDASDAGTITESGGVVSQWDDKSGGNFDFTAPSTGPSLLTSQQNGLDVLSFDGTANSRLSNGTINPGQPLTYFIVCQSDTPSGGRQYVFDGDTANNSERQLLALRGNNTNEISIWAGSPPSWFSSGFTTTTDWILVSAQFDGSNSKISVDGATAVSGSVGNQNTASGLIIGANYAVSSDFLDGQIAEFIVVDQASFDTGNARRIEGYLAHKWGLTASLPVDHPYKDAAPTLWDSIKTACVMAGWDNLDGALTVLKGTDVPTNNNFVAADYDRTDGLKGDGSTTYLDSGRANDDDPQDSSHNALFVSTANTADPAILMGDGTSGSTGKNRIVFASPTANLHFDSRSLGSSDVTVSPTNQTGFLGHSRSGSSLASFRVTGSTNTYSMTSTTPTSTNVHVFSRESGGLPTDARLAFYSIGESLDLAALDTLITQLIADIAEAMVPTSLLLNCNGTNGSTTFTDSSPNAVTVTANGNAQISTAQSKFGGASAVFDGNGDYLSIANQSWMSFGSDDFTIETWFYIAGDANLNNSSVRSGTLASCFPTVGTFENTWAFSVVGDVTTTGTGLTFTLRDASATQFNATYTGTISQTTWHHAAAVRNGNTVTLYFNGVSVATVDVTGQTFSTSQQLSVGRLGFPGYEHELNGYIDDLRITQGAALYKVDFTPPTSELTSY